MIPNIKINSTKDILNKDARMAMLLFAATGRGKTQLAGSLNDLTLKYLGKPTLLIAMETGEGGGTATLRDKDIPIYVPKSYSELKGVVSALKSDKDFGGVIFDSATEMAKSLVKPAALKFTPRERSAVVLEPRNEGIPTQSDYAPIGEMVRMLLQDVINLSAAIDPSVKKHVIVTALQKEKTDDQNRITFDGPSLPGAMATEAGGMFQQVGSIDLKASLIGGKRVMQRWLCTNPKDTIRLVKDRYKILPGEILLRDPSLPQGEGEDLLTIWEKYWLPAINATQPNQERGSE